MYYDLNLIYDPTLRDQVLINYMHKERVGVPFVKFRLFFRKVPMFGVLGARMGNKVPHPGIYYSSTANKCKTTKLLRKI